MENDYEKLKRDVEELKSQVRNLTQELAEHNHNGIRGNRVDLFDLLGSIKTVNNATELTRVTAEKPRNVWEQIFIDTSTGTKKLYIYDMESGGAGWKSTTIS